MNRQPLVGETFGRLTALSEVADEDRRCDQREARDGGPGTGPANRVGADDRTEGRPMEQVADRWFLDDDEEEAVARRVLMFCLVEPARLLYRRDVIYRPGWCFSCNDPLPEFEFGRCALCRLAWRLSVAPPPGAWTDADLTAMRQARDGARLCG